MTRRIIGACGFLVLGLAGSCARRPPEPWSYDEHVGLAVITRDSACITVANSSPPVNSRVHVIDTAQQREFPGSVIAPRDACVDVAGSSLRGYEIRMEATAPPTPFIGIAVVSSAAQFRTRGNDLTSDLDGDGRDEFFRSCTSQEGVHLTIWSEAPLTGRRRWHRYHALGYDVSPTCTSAEVSAP